MFKKIIFSVFINIKLIICIKYHTRQFFFYRINRKQLANRGFTSTSFQVRDKYYFIHNSHTLFVIMFTCYHV